MCYDVNCVGHSLDLMLEDIRNVSQIVVSQGEDRLGEGGPGQNQG